jgi:hypothetical protein
MDMLRTAGDLGPALDGEDTESPFPDDARHWVTVYSELLAVAVKAGAEAMADRFSARLAFWKRRLKGLRDLSA